MAITPQKALTTSKLAQLSLEELTELEAFEADVDAALMDHFDGWQMIITCKASAKMIGEAARRYRAKNWSVEIDVVEARKKDPQTGAPIVGQDPFFTLTLEAK